jgi:histidine triad (HIT) family protein
MPSIFTRIIRRQAPAEIVYEDDKTIAFLDIFPAFEGHTLVVPKVEIANFEDLPAENACALVLAVQRVARGVMKAMDTPHYSLGLNNGSAAGQVVFHVHVHVMPRQPGVPHHKQPLDPAQAKVIGAKIRAALQELSG